MDRPEERVALIELFDRDGRVARCIDVFHWPLTLGRALDNHIVIDDPHVAAHHAVLAPEADGLALTALPTRNGVWLANRRIDGRAAVPAGGAALQLGATRLRLRLPGEILSPERPLPTRGRGDAAVPALLALAVFAVLLAGHWVSLDPGADYSAWLPMLIGVPVVVAGWCAIWALMSKLFQHRFDFGGHLRIVLPWLLGMSVADLVWPQVAAALAAPWLWMLSGPLQALLAALLVRAHLGHVLPLHQRAVTLTVATFTVAAAGLSTALTYRSSDSFSSAPYMSTLPTPALRLTGTAPSATLVQDMAPLAAKLAQRVKKAKEDDSEDGDPGE